VNCYSIPWEAGLAGAAPSSDGLHGVVGREDLEKILRKQEPIEDESAGWLYRSGARGRCAGQRDGSAAAPARRNRWDRSVGQALLACRIAAQTE